MNIALVQSPLNMEATPIPTVGALPPLGLLALATYVKQHIPSTKIKVIDGDLKGIEEAQEELNKTEADIIGIGVQSCESYQSALKLAQCAKKKGAIVVMGGEQATNRALQILKNREYIDYVITGQGEAALVALISNQPLESIPNLLYRRNEKVRSTFQRRIPLHQLPIPDRAYSDLDKYAYQFQQTLESKLTVFRKFTTIRTQDGCLKAIRQGVCTFCKRDDLFLAGFRRPEKFWEEMQYLESLGVDYAWDIAASFASVGHQYLNALASDRPLSARIRFRVYARADDLALEENVAALAQLGVENVLVGFDSGNQRCLDASNKHTTLEQHRRAAKNLREYTLATYAGFVLGHIAETQKSMYETFVHAQELKEIIGEKLFRTTTCSKMQLYPGTKEWHRYLQAFPEESTFYENADDIDIQKLSEKYLKKYLHLDPAEADVIAKKIRSLSPIQSGKDMKHYLLAH